MKQDYLRIMERATGAYSDRQIDEYIAAVREGKLTEHGFARLTSDIGILLAHGVRKDLLPRFLDMMDLCCDQMPNRKHGAHGESVGNDFTVKEVSFCLMEIEAAGLVPAEKLAGWKEKLSHIDPYETYNEIARVPNIRIGNWAAYAAASETLRAYLGLGRDEAFLDNEIASQLLSFEQNGMYRDPNEPMLYDMATRVQLAVLLKYGYRGEYAEEIDRYLRKGGLMSLNMQSVTGEIPYGGRSNQYLFNEAYLAAVCEYEAARYAKEGNADLAGQFKDAAAMATASIFQWMEWLDGRRHVKNNYPQEDTFGCEGYGYFNKYMTTLASFVYLAYVFADDDIAPVPCPARGKTHTLFTSAYFHKFFAFAGGYMLEFDTRADEHYDATGLGRVHRAGAPGPIALSNPFTVHPAYEIGGVKNPGMLCLCGGVRRLGRTVLACEGSGISAIRVDRETETEAAFTVTEMAGGRELTERYTVNAQGVEIELTCPGDIAFAIPAFLSDGKNTAQIVAKENTLSVSFRGHTYTVRTDGALVDTGLEYRGRNGVSVRWEAQGKDALRLHLAIE